MYTRIIINVYNKSNKLINTCKFYYNKDVGSKLSRCTEM